MVILTMKGQ